MTIVEQKPEEESQDEPSVTVQNDIKLQTKEAKEITTDGSKLINEDVFGEEEEKIILIAKKNPLETQILSKILVNLNCKIEIINEIELLDEKVQKSVYDLLFIDKGLETANQNRLKKRHRDLKVVRLSPNRSNDAYLNSNIQEELVGIMSGDTLKEIIQKYRG